MEWGWSKGHRKERQAEERKKMVLESLPLLQLTEQQYKEMEGYSNFLLIIGIALNRGITYWKAEIAFYDERREAEREKLRRGLNVDSWQGDGTGVHTDNIPYNFDDEHTIYHYLQGHTLPPDES